MNITSNIDNIESKAGIEKVTFAHGRNVGAECSKCGAEKGEMTLKEAMKANNVQRCLNTEPEEASECGGPIKPKIVFAG